MGNFFNATLLGLCKQFFADSGMTAVLVLLGVALFAFAPANLAFMKNLKARGLIALMNFASICLLASPFYISVLLWILAFFLAGKGRRRIPKPDRLPERPLPPNAQNMRVLQHSSYENNKPGYF